LNKKTHYIQEFNSVDILGEKKVLTCLAVPMASNAGESGVIYLESYTKKDILPEYIKLVEITAKIFVTSMKLQKLIEETMFLIDDEFVTVAELTNQRTELTAIIGDISDEQQVFVEALAEASDAKGHYKKEHYKNVAKTSKDIASYLKLNEKTVDLIYYAECCKTLAKSCPRTFCSRKSFKRRLNKLQIKPHWR
jgi:response regulator RpfG family c-di-GMP phosphodiesterase